MDQFVYENKERIYEIFCLSKTIPIEEIRLKIVNSSYLYLVQCWNNISQADSREFYTYISNIIFENLKNGGLNDYKYFINSLMKFPHHIHNIINHIYNTTNDSNFINNLYNFNMEKNKIYTEDLHHYYNQLLFDDKILRKLMSFNNVTYDNPRSLFNDSFIGIMMDNISQSITNNNNQSIVVCIDLLVKLIQMGNYTKEKVLHWFENYINLNNFIGKMGFINNIVENEDFETTMSYSDKYEILFISKVTIQLWEHFNSLMKEEKYNSFKLNIDILDNSNLKCKNDSRLHSECIKNLDDIDINVVNVSHRLFFLVHKILHYTIHSLLDRISEYKKIEADYEFLFSSVNMMKSLDKLGKMKDYYKQLLKNKLKRTKEYTKECRDIINDTYLNKCINNFYEYTFKWYNNLYENNNDDMIKRLPVFLVEFVLNHISDMFNEKMLSQSGSFLTSLVRFCVYFINDTKNVSNIYLRCKASNLLSFLFVEAEYMPYASDSICKKYLIESIINIYIDVENTGSDNQFYMKHEPRYNISYLLCGLFNIENSEYVQILEELSDKKPNLIKRFIVLNLYDLSYMLDEIITNIEIVNNTTRYTPESVIRCGNILRNDLMYCYDQLKLLDFSYKNITTLFISEEIIQQFVSLSMNYIKQFMSVKMKTILKSKYSYKPEKIINYLIKPYLSISENEIVITSIMEDKRGYYPGIFTDACKFLSKTDFLSKIEEMHLSMVNEIVDRKLQTNEFEDDDEVPDELLDPIMFILIKEPVILPSSKNIMDKGVIVRHLLSDQQDPFNRDPLTIEELEEYNSKDEVKEKLKDFNVKIQEHLNKNKVKSEENKKKTIGETSGDNGGEDGGEDGDEESLKI